MRTIYKYQLKLKVTQKIEMPIDHRILHIEEDTKEKDTFNLWAAVNTDSLNENFPFHIYGTGWDLVDHRLADIDNDYLATVVCESDGSEYVWHFFKGRLV